MSVYLLKVRQDVKNFGLDDHDMLSILKNYFEIRFITGDKKGFKISKRRIVDDMSFKLDLVSTIKRLDWIQKKMIIMKILIYIIKKVKNG